jgi:transposase-like protein
MTKASVALKEYLSNIGLEADVDFLQESIQVLTQMLIELEAEEKVGAEKHERTPERSNHRNGYRQRVWETRVVK